MNNLKPCPFCGETPTLPDGTGTQYEIECTCGKAGVSIQISDYMTIEERLADEFSFSRYSNEYIDRAQKAAIVRWNTRVSKPEEKYTFTNKVTIIQPFINPRTGIKESIELSGDSCLLEVYKELYNIK